MEPSRARSHAAAWAINGGGCGVSARQPVPSIFASGGGPGRRARQGGEGSPARAWPSYLQHPLQQLEPSCGRRPLAAGRTGRRHQCQQAAGSRRFTARICDSVLYLNYAYLSASLAAAARAPDADVLALLHEAAAAGYKAPMSAVGQPEWVEFLVGCEPMTAAAMAAAAGRRTARRLQHCLSQCQ